MENRPVIFILDKNLNSREILKSYIEDFNIDIEIKLYSDYTYGLQEIKNSSRNE